MNRLRHYATYGNTRDFRPEDEEKPPGEVTFVEPAWSDAEIGKHRFRRRLFHSDKLLVFLYIYSQSNMTLLIVMGDLGLGTFPRFRL
jgi:hypothetical protein